MLFRSRGAGERALSAADIEKKFFENATLAMSRTRADAICDAVRTLERRPARALMRVLAG